MKAIEHLVLRVADSDLTWFGFGWLRPAKQQPVGFGYVLFSSVLLGLPGIGVGVGLIYWFLGRVEPRVWLAMFALVMMVELPLHVLFAHYWNRRAASLANGNDAS
jgi:hypothetical protein